MGREMQGKSLKPSASDQEGTKSGGPQSTSLVQTKKKKRSYLLLGQAIKRNQQNQKGG